MFLPKVVVIIRLVSKRQVAQDARVVSATAQLGSHSLDGLPRLAPCIVDAAQLRAVPEHMLLKQTFAHPIAR